MSIISSDTDTPLPEVFDPKTGRTYAVAQCDQNYKVKLSTVLDNFDKYPYIAAHLYVDDTTVGDGYILDRKLPSATFTGFRTKTSTTVECELFQFKLPEVDMNTEAGPSTFFRHGKITGKFYEAFRKEEDKKMEHGYRDGERVTHSREKVPKMPMDRKNPFMAPSLVTGSGGIVKRPLPVARNYKYRSGESLARFTVYYATPMALLFHQILRRDNPAHATILDMFDETRYEPPPLEEGLQRRLDAAGPRDVINLVTDDEEEEEVVDLADDVDDELED